jgi:hypothetical protein
VVALVSSVLGPSSWPAHPGLRARSVVLLPVLTLVRRQPHFLLGGEHAT